MPVASQTYKIFQSSAKEECSLIAKKIVTIEADARKREEIIREIDLFDKDWSIYCDKNMPRRIQRLKEQTDRLYKKLALSQRSVRRNFDANFVNIFCNPIGI